MDYSNYLYHISSDVYRAMRMQGVNRRTIEVHMNQLAFDTCVNDAKGQETGIRTQFFTDRKILGVSVKIIKCDNESEPQCFVVQPVGEV